MSWWVWIIVIVVVLVFIGSMFGGKEDKAYSSKKTKLPKNDKSSNEIADEVKTVAQFLALERRLEEADEKRQLSTAYDARSLKSEERTEVKYQLLQQAYDLVSNRVLRWQFIPNIDLNTSLSVAQSAYKVFTVSEYEDTLSEFGGNKNEWYGLRGDEEPDEKDEEIKFIIKFRTIVEIPELSEAEKDKKINSLVSRNKEEAIDYFDLDCDKTAGEQWREEIFNKPL